MKENQNCGERSAKWRALVDDTGVPLPQRVVAVAVIRAQSGIGNEFVLVRDHNSPNDVVLDDGDTVDLSEGNVFYTLLRCDVQPRGGCEAPPKLALFVDDRGEVAIRPEQTGKTVHDLFSIPPHVQLLRDYESPNDEVIGLDDPANFADGPVFITRQREMGLKITVNSRVFTEDDGVRSQMTGEQVAVLVFPENPRETRVWLLSPERREVGLDEPLVIHGCEKFDVVRKGVEGGYEASRVDREVGMLRDGGATITVVSKPAAVIYHALSVKPGLTVAETDVLVLVPGGYPGQMLDGAYLPSDSPLFGKVKGKAQGNKVTADGRSWRLVSYHPHTNGVGPEWNPTRYGFHTYLGELLSWLYDAN